MILEPTSLLNAEDKVDVFGEKMQERGENEPTENDNCLHLYMQNSRLRLIRYKRKNIQATISEEHIVLSLDLCSKFRHQGKR